jgi:hypothetical protein
MRPTAFVSSVIEGFESYREAAAVGLKAAGVTPLRVEDLPSTDRSPRNVCLDLVEACDIYVVIIGSRGGWTSPSGMKVTEEEYEHAKALGKPILAFLEDVRRDEDAERLAREISDYVHGAFRSTFSGPNELAEAVERAVRGILPRFTMPMRDPEEVQSCARRATGQQHEAMVRLVVAPERRGELVDPVLLDDAEVIDGIYQLGHEPEVGLFAYENPKTHQLKGYALEIEQTQADHRSPRRLVRLSISSAGLVSIDLNVTGRVQRGRAHSGLDALMIVEADVSAAVRTAIRGTAAILDHLDPHKRYDRLLLQASLAGAEHRSWSRDGAERGSYPMRMSRTETVLAMPEPRVLSRPELPAAEQRIVALLRRQMEE